MLLTSFIISILALLFVVYLVVWIKKNDMGTAKMQEIYEAIKKGANAFLKRQYKTIAMITVVLALVLWMMI